MSAYGIQNVSGCVLDTITHSVGWLLKSTLILLVFLNRFLLWDSLHEDQTTSILYSSNGGQFWVYEDCVTLRKREYFFADFSLRRFKESISMYMWHLQSCFLQDVRWKIAVYLKYPTNIPLLLFQSKFNIQNWI